MNRHHALTLTALLTLATATATADDRWHHPLFAGDGDYWHQRIRVEVRHRGAAPVRGLPVALGVGEGAGEVRLAGAEAAALRVCDEAGTEMLFHLEVAPPETLTLAEEGAAAPWYDDDPGDEIFWDFRVPVALVNTRDQVVAPVLVTVDLNRYLARYRELALSSLRVLDGTRVVDHYLAEEILLFTGDAAPETRHTYHLYLSFDSGIAARPGSDFAGLARRRGGRASGRTDRRARGRARGRAAASGRSR